MARGNGCHEHLVDQFTAIPFNRNHVKRPKACFPVKQRTGCSHSELPQTSQPLCRPITPPNPFRIIQTESTGWFSPPWERRHLPWPSSHLPFASERGLRAHPPRQSLRLLEQGENCQFLQLMATFLRDNNQAFLLILKRLAFLSRRYALIFSRKWLPKRDTNAHQINAISNAV